MMTPQRKAHERLMAIGLPTRTHHQPPPPTRGRGPGFMLDKRTWARRAKKKSPMRGRKT